MRKIIFSKSASRKLEDLLDYLENEWSGKVKLNFIRKLDKSLELIQKFPESCEKSDIKKGLFRCVVTKQTTLFYQFTSTAIKIVALFDNRMDPLKLKTEIK